MNPLAGLRVLDLTRLLPGGIATLILADLGANVLKIEDPHGGDYARWMPPLVDGLSAFFRMNNRNKRSLILDLKHPDGPETLRRLAEGADVLIEGFRPEVMARLGCDSAALRARNPRLVVCSLSGWGADGPYAARSGHDLNYTALAGILGGLETPQNLSIQAADLAGAMMAVNGVLAALLRRGTTGEGGVVDVSLFESALPLALYGWIEAHYNGVGGGQGGLNGGLACYRVYRTSDEPIALAALEPKFWGRFCGAVGRPDLEADYLLPERQAYLRLELEQIFAQHTAAEWAARLEPADCCFSRVAPPSAPGDDPQAQARGLVGRFPDGMPWLKTPLKLDGLAVEPGPVPGYGEHTRAALADYGFTADEIDSLAEKGAVRQGA